MSVFAALALYPLWAAAAVVAATVVRLGRPRSRGLLLSCALLAVWVASLILLENPTTSAIGERAVPIGALLAGATVHAGAELVGMQRRALVGGAYALSGAVALIGLVAPRLLFGPGARGPGPLFFPIAALAALSTPVLVLWLARAAQAARGRERRQRAASAAACLFGSLGCGGLIGLRILGLGDIAIAAPLLLLAVLIAAYAVIVGEEGRARALVVQGLVQAGFTAALSAVGLTVFFRLMPILAPDAASTAWIAFVLFFATIPLDPVRMIVVERLGRALFANPIGIRDLAERVEASEARADHAERLAEIGALASAVAHEIRNPLGVIAAQAKLLERQGARPETVAALRAQIDRARRFLDDLLRYSRPRPLELREIEVLPALQLAATNAKQSLGDDAARVDVEVALVGDDPLFLEVDRGAFGDVATILIHNACIAAASRRSAADPGGRNEIGKVRVAAEAADQVVIVRVDDDGPGVPTEILTTLFQPFVTGRGRDARHPGTGLGLAIAARQVERHGGAISHETPANGGACFIVRWPRSPLGPSQT